MAEDTLIPEYCPVNSPTLRCPKTQKGENDTVLCCVKYVNHLTPCRFELFPGGRNKRSSDPPPGL